MALKTRYRRSVALKGATACHGVESEDSKLRIEKKNWRKCFVNTLIAVVTSESKTQSHPQVHDIPRSWSSFHAI